MRSLFNSWPWCLPGKRFEIGIYTRGDVMKFNIAASRSQLRKISLSVALVSAFEVLRKRDIDFFAFAVPFDNRVRYIIETLRLTGAGIEYAGDVTMLEKP